MDSALDTATPTNTPPPALATANAGIPFADAIDRIRQQVDIVDIVGRVVPLKRSGRNYTGLCPFHNDKNPSFSVNREKNLYKCFSCGEGGDAFNFIMKQHNKTFGEVIYDLADDMGIVITRSGKAPQQVAQEKQEKATILALNTVASQWFGKQLASPAGETIRTYLTNRGVDADIAARFKLGYAPPGWENLLQHLLQQHQQNAPNPAAVVHAGLATERPAEEGKPARVYDRFRDRLIIPIDDEQGRCVAFGGRAFDEFGPKYLNSPETPVYHKSRLLYGLNLAAPAIRQHGQVVIMEGYFDVIAAHQAGVPQAVGVCGTALTEQHIRLLVRHGAKEVVLCLDADDAGQRATHQSLELLKPFQDELSPYVVVIPDGKDPADYRQTHGNDALQALFARQSGEKQDALAFRIHSLLKEHDLTTQLGKANATQQLAPILGAVTNPVRFRHYASLAAHRLGIVAEDMMAACKTHRPQFSATQRPTGPYTTRPTPITRTVAATPKTLSPVEELELHWFALLFMNTDSYNLMLPRLAEITMVGDMALWCQQQIMHVVADGHTTLEACTRALQQSLDAQLAHGPEADDPSTAHQQHFWTQCLFNASQHAEEWTPLMTDRPQFFKKLAQHIQRLEIRLTKAHRARKLLPLIQQTQTLENEAHNTATPEQIAPADALTPMVDPAEPLSLAHLQTRFRDALQHTPPTNLESTGNFNSSSSFPIPQGLSPT